MTRGTHGHVWGVSPARDRIWAQVAGLAPSMIAGRHFMIFQAFIDDSYDQGATYVLAGHIATVDAWDAFTKEWEELLPGWGTINDNGKWHFKMSEMARNPDCFKRVPAFYRIIEKHVLMSICCQLNIAELESARNRIYVPNLEINWNIAESPFLVAFMTLMDVFHTRRELLEKILPIDAKVDFYFDNDSKKKEIYEAWDEYMSSRPIAIRGRYGATPRFEDDTEFLPLQAADLWAWWARKWHAEGTPEKMQKADFGTWSGLREKHAKVDISTDEDGMVGKLIGIIRERIEPGRLIYDVRYPKLPLW